VTALGRGSPHTGDAAQAQGGRGQASCVGRPGSQSAWILTSVAAVSVDVPGLLDAWEEAEYGMLPFLFEPDGGDVLAQMDAVARVGWAVMKRHEEACWDPAPGDVFVHVGGPDYSPMGVVFTLGGASSPEAFAGWLSEFAEELTEAGLAGRVSRQPEGPDLPRWYNWLPPGQYTAFVYYDVVDPLLYAATPGQWNVNGEITARIANAIAGWQLPDATRLLMSVGGSSELPPGGGDVIEAALHGTRGLCHVDSLIADPPRLRRVQCKPSGQAAWMVGDSRLKWRERLATAVEALTALPDCTRFGFVQPASKNDTSNWGLVRLGRAQPRCTRVRAPRLRCAAA
jgi:hypothetical protein